MFINFLELVYMGVIKYQEIIYFIKRIKIYYAYVEVKGSGKTLVISGRRKDKVGERGSR